MYPIGEITRLWFVAWIGIALAGGVFGALAGAAVGMLAGPFIAAFFAVPVVGSVAVLAWALWFDRALILAAAIAGGVTGFVATAVLWGPIFMLEYREALTAATILGALGAAITTSWYSRRYGHGYLGNVFIPRGWHYSLSDLFWRFTAVTLLVAVWSLVIGRMTNGPPS